MVGHRGIAALGVVALFATGCSGSSSSDGKEQIVAAFYPLAFAADRVGGDLVDVESLTPSGVEPHDLELKASQVRDISGADLVFYLGQGFQPAVEDVVSQLDESHTLDALGNRNLREGTGDEAGEVDPHVWLDPVTMSDIVDRFAARLGGLDPAHAGTYRRNATTLEGELKSLDKEFRIGLADCRRHEIVTSHAAFAYMAARYGLDQVSVSGIDPEAEPSPGRLAEVARFVKEHGVTTIFFEELAPRDVADTLARETGASIEVLSPLETKPENGDYMDQMRVNLDHLEKALDCG